MFLMVFIIQKTQNKYPKEIIIKLKNLFISRARNVLANIQNLPAKKFNLHKFYKKISMISERSALTLLSIDK